MNDVIPENIVIKLFDQVADSSEKNSDATEKLTTVIGDLNDTLKDVERDNKQKLSDIHKEITTQNLEIGKIKKVSYDIKSRVTTMIAVVLITFSLMLISYFFVSSGIDKTVDIKVKHAIEQVIKK